MSQLVTVYPSIHTHTHTHTHTHRHRHTHAARIDSKSCRASCEGLLTTRTGSAPHAGYLGYHLREHTVIPHVSVHGDALCVSGERAREGEGGVEREEVQPAASKFGCNVTRPTSADEFAIRAEIIRNNNTFLTSVQTFPLPPELWMPRLGRNVHHDTARSSFSVWSVYWVRREHGTGRLGSAPVRPTAKQAGRQQRAAVGGEPPGRQAGRARKLKAVV